MVKKPIIVPDSSAAPFTATGMAQSPAGVTESETRWRVGLEWVPDAYFKAIGSVVVAHGQLEYMLRLLIKRCSADTFQQSLKSTEKVRQMAELKKQVQQAALPPEVCREVLDNLERIIDGRKPPKGFSPRRNRVVHGRWSLDHDSGLVLNEFNRQVNEYTPAEIERLAEEIDAVTKLLHRLVPPVGRS